MVAIVTSGGLGLERSSSNLLGGRGVLGSAAQGRAGDRVTVNAATGNLIIQNTDEVLVGKGPDAVVNRTYNSLGSYTNLAGAADPDNWLTNTQRKIVLTTGTANTAGSKATLTDWDGSTVVFNFVSAAIGYQSIENPYRDDTLTFASNVWTWTEGKSRRVEKFANNIGGRITESADTDGNKLVYAYSGATTAATLTSITTQNVTGQTGNTTFTYSGSNVASIVTNYNDAVNGTTKQLTRTRYTYDGSNRLITVTTDLSPEDNLTTDGRTYVTTYTYDGASKRVASIAQSDGSLLSFVYDASGRVTSFTQTVESGVTRTTSFAYGAGYTYVTDPQLQQTVLYYDASGRMTRIDEPAQVSGGIIRITDFNYLASGDVYYSSTYDGPANFGSGIYFDRTWYRYDANGNVLDAYVALPGSGYRVTRWAYGAQNQVLTETTYTGLDLDGHGGVDPTGGMTTRYVYDSENHLRFRISAEGRVTEYLYDGSLQTAATTVNGAGQLTTMIDYNNTLYSLTGLTESQSPTEAQLMTWRSTANMPDKTNVLRTDTTYDFRGNVSTVTTFEKVDSNGNNSFGSGYGDSSRTTYVYDQYGNLLSKLANDGSQAETYAYDGLGRVIRFTDAKGVGTWTTYVDAQTRTVVTLANGLTKTSSYNKAGELVASTEARGGVATENLAPPLTGWSLDRVTTASAGLIDGAVGLQVTVAGAGNSQSQGIGFPTGFSVAIGDSLVAALSFQATTSSASAAFGIYGAGTAAGGWGTNNIATARIVSGPGTLQQSVGGLWYLSGLSTTEATRVEITRVFTQVGSADVRVYPDYPAGGVVGRSIVISAPDATIRRYDTSGSASFYGLDINGWVYAGFPAPVATTLPNGELANKYTAPAAGGQPSISYAGQSVNAGDTVAFTVSLLGVGTVSTASFGLYGSYSNGWGAPGVASVRLVSGPGTLLPAGYGGGLWQVSGLSTTVATRVEVTRTFDLADYAYAYVYPKLDQIQAGDALILGAPSITRTLGTKTSYKYDSLGRLRIKTDPVGTKSFYFYDKLGRRIAMVDGDGSATEYKYDVADRLVATVDYAAALSAVQIASLFDGYGNPTAVEFASVRPGVAAADRWSWNVYDRAGKLIETIDAAGAVQQFEYDGASRLTKSTRYYALLAATTVNGADGLSGYRTATPTALVLPTADATNDRVVRNFYDNDGLAVAALDQEGFLTDFVYDKAARQTGTIRYASRTGSTYWANGTYAQLRGSITTVSPDIFTYTLYDGRGLVGATIDGEGNVTRYHYTARGQVDQEVRGQQVAANTAYTLANLPAAAGTLETTNYVRNGLGQVTSRVRLLSGGQTETTAYTYDSVGNLLSETTSETVSVETRAQSYRYDAKGRLIGSLTGVGSSVLSAGQTQAQIDSIYATYGTRYQYDAADRLIAKTTPDGGGTTGNKTLYYYDGDGQLRYEINALGEVTEYRYNVLEDKTDTFVYGTRVAVGTLATLNGGLVTATVISTVAAIANAALDSRMQYDPDNRGLSAVTKDPLGNASGHYYNAFGEWIQTNAPTGDAVNTLAINQAGYDRRGLKYYDYQYLNYNNQAQIGSLQQTYSSDAFGRTVTAYSNNTDWRYHSYQYDRNGRLTYDYDVYSKDQAFWYDARGNQIWQRDRNGKTTNFTYDLFNRNVTTTTPEGILSSVKKNAYGQTISITDGAGRVKSYSYDKNGNLKTVTDAAGTTTNTYDNADRLIDVVDARGTDTHYTYDAAGRVLTRVENYGGLNLTTSYAYDAKGQTLSVTDASNAITTYSYDLKGQKTRVVQDAGRLNLTTDYVYRADGKVVSMTEGVGTGAARKTSYVYDSAGRLTETHIDPAGLNLTTKYAYDVNNNVVAVTDERGFITRFVFDKENRQILGVNAQGEATETGYDGEGQAIWTRGYANRIAVATVNGFALEVGEATVRASLVGSTSDRINRTLYDGDGRRAWAVDGEGYATRFVYDGANNLIKTIQYASAVATTNTTAKADLDANYGAVASAPVSAAVTEFGYDSANRLISTTDAGGFDLNGVATRYAEYYQLDAAGNRTQLTNKLGGITQYTYDALGRLTHEWVNAPVYDNAGTQLATAYYKNIYEYDALGHVTRNVEGYTVNASNVVLPGARNTYYAYDTAGRRIQKTGDAVSTLDINTGVETSVTPTETVKYDARGNVIETVDAAGARTLLYYDAADRKIAEVNGIGTYSAYTYDAHGNLTSRRVYGNALTPIPVTAGGAPPTPPAGEYRETSYFYDYVNRISYTNVTGVRVGSFDGATYTTSVPTITTLSYVDAFGNVVREVDGIGNNIYHYYDKNGREIARVDQDNDLTKWTRDGEGNVLTETRYATRIASVIDQTTAVASLVTAVGASADDRTTSFSYDKNGRRLTETRVNVGSYTTTAAGALVGSSNSATIAYAYNGLGEVLRKTEASGDVIDYVYDNQGRMQRQRDPAQADYAGVAVIHVTDFLYDGLNNVVRSEEAIIAPSTGGYASGYSSTDNRVNRFTYGAGGRLASSIDALGTTHNYRYNKAGQVVEDRLFRTKNNPTGGVFTVTEIKSSYYDVLGRFTGQSSATNENNVWAYQPTNAITYNAYGDVTTKSVGGVVTEQFIYDTAGRVVKTNSGDGVWKFFVYDANGNATLKLTASGASDESATAYDAAIASVVGTGALASFNQAWLLATVIKYNARGLQIASYEPNRTIADTNNAANTVTQTLVSSRTYNAFGEVASETSARGFTTNYTYNAMGRLTKRESPLVSVTGENGAAGNLRPTETYYYDISGRLIASQDANTYTTTRALLAGTGYGGSDAKVLKEFRPDSSVWETRYDGFGDARRMIDGLGRTTQQLFDKAGRVTQITKPSGFTDYYAYDELGQRTRHWNSFLGASVVEKTDYDNVGRVISTVDFTGHRVNTGYVWNPALTPTGLSAVPLGGWIKTTSYVDAQKSMTESTDVFGHQTGKTDLGGNTTSYSYDKAGRLISQSGSTGQALAYTWYNTGKIKEIKDTAGVQFAYYTSDITSSFTYDANGNRVTSKYVSTSAYDGYDWEGNYTGTFTYINTLENATALYDTLDRIIRITDPGDAANARPSFMLDKTYDAASNVRSVIATHDNIGSNQALIAASTDNYWYKYDSLNRLVTTKGQLINNAIVRDNTGVDVAYDAAGQRAFTLSSYSGSFIDQFYIPSPGPGYVSRVVNYTSTAREDYSYNADGFLATVQIAGERVHYDENSTTISTFTGTNPTGPGTLRVTDTRDAMGRVTLHTEYLADGATIAYQRSAAYNAASQVISDSTSGTAGTAATSYYYTDYNSGLYDNGAVGWQSGSTTPVNGGTTYATLTNSYIWRDAALQSSIVNVQSGAVNGTTTSTLSYDANAHLSYASTTGQAAKSISYTTDAAGQVMVRTQSTSGSANSPRQFYFYFNGLRVGEVGNNSTDNVDYSSAIAANGSVAGAGPFRGGATTGASYADFDENYAAINTSSAAEAGASATYTVRSGDTLQSIAQSVWGDAGLWYMLAEANGLTGSTSLSAGQSLTIPAKVSNFHNTAQTFKPYDAGKAIGDVQPGAPVPPPAKSGGGCGALGTILLVVIAVAVVALTAGALAAPTSVALSSSGSALAGTFTLTSVVTLGGPLAGIGIAGAGLAATVGAAAIAGAAGSVVSQLVGVATGIQDKFSWKGVALAAISGGVGGGLGNVALLGKSAGAFLNGAARGALGNALTQGVATATGLQDKFDWAGVAVGAAVGGTVSGVGARFAQAPARSVESYGQQLVTGAAGALAGAATRSLINGTDFGDNVLVALPDVIGSTIGNAVARGVSLNSLASDGQRRMRGIDGPRNRGVQLASLGTGLAGLGITVDNLTTIPARTSAALSELQAYGRKFLDSLESNAADIVVTARRNATNIYNDYLDPLAARITNSLTGENIGRTTIASLANVVLPSSGTFVASFVARSDATAFGNGVKQGTIGLVQSTIALGKALQDVGPIGQVNALLQRTTGYTLPGAPNANNVLVPAANIGRTVGRYVSTATPSSVAADVGSVYSAASGAISRFGALDAASQRAAILYGAGYALPQIASLAVGGEFAGVARVGGVLETGGAALQRSALLNRVSETLATGGRYRLSEAKGIVYTAREANRLGYDLVDASLAYRGRQGVDLVFQSRATGDYAIWEAKGGFSQKGLSALTTDTRGIMQGSEAYNLSRLQRYIDFGNGANNNLANALLGQANRSGIDSFVSLYGSRTTYQLPIAANVIRPSIVR